ncbi:MAG: hypothetical protein Hens2KO_09550 [Henriciella sp.]
MKISHGLSAFMAGLVLTVFPTSAHSQEDGGFAISMDVPVVCNLDAETFSIEQSQNSVTGTVREFCNSAIGFQIVAGHRPLSSNERVEVEYDGTASDLDGSGFSIISFRSGARAESVPVTIRTENVSEALSVSFAITAI